MLAAVTRGFAVRGRWECFCEYAGSAIRFRERITLSTLALKTFLDENSSLNPFVEGFASKHVSDSCAFAAMYALYCLIFLDNMIDTLFAVASQRRGGLIYQLNLVKIAIKPFSVIWAIISIRTCASTRRDGKPSSCTG